jgi:hypothetical protein
MSEINERKRFVDVNTLNDEQRALLEAQIGEKVAKIVDESVEKANKILPVYGLKSKMQLLIEVKD